MEEHQFPGKMTRIRIRSNNFYLPTVNDRDLIDNNFENKRFAKNRKFKTHKDWLQKDIKDQKEKSKDYRSISRKLSRIIIRTFFALLLKDIVTTGEKFLLPTKQGKVWLGVDSKKSQSFNLLTGNEKRYIRVKAEEYFWLPYPISGVFQYEAFLSRDYREMLEHTLVISDWSDTKDEY
jgi:hypothetical protein